mgnify:CR=1 FL=1
MPSVITVYFGQTRFLSISQHRPEMPTRVVLAHCAVADLPPYICTTNWQNAVRDLRQPVWPACRGWAYVHDICENCWPGAWEPDFLGIFVNDSTQNFIVHMLQVNLCGVETQKTKANMQMVLSILMRSMVASKHVYVLQLSG